MVSVLTMVIEYGFKQTDDEKRYDGSVNVSGVGVIGLITYVKLPGPAYEGSIDVDRQPHTEIWKSNLVFLPTRVAVVGTSASHE